MVNSKLLNILSLVSLTSLSGCERHIPNYVEGVVKGEFGNLPGIVSSRGALFGNESIKIDNLTYVLKIEASEGIYIASVIQDDGNKSLEALEVAINEGTRVRFPKSFSRGYEEKNMFGEDRIGKIYSSSLEVID